MKYSVLLAVLVLSACTNPEKTKTLLERQGYTDVEITGWRPLACDTESDTYATGFRAKSPNGSETKGTVCAGLLFKDATIRYEF